MKPIPPSKPTPPSKSSDETKRLGPTIPNKSIVVSLIRLTLWFVLFVACMFVIPQFQRMFEEFAIDLPRITKLVLAFSDRMLKLWFLLIPGFMVTLAIFEAIAIFLPASFGSSEVLLRRCLNLLAWSALVLAITITVLGMIAPSLAIMSGLSGK